MTHVIGSSLNHVIYKGNLVDSDFENSYNKLNKKSTFENVLSDVTSKNVNNSHAEGLPISKGNPSGSKIPTYTSNANVRDTFLTVAKKRYANENFSSDQIREIAYYIQLQFDLEKQMNSITSEEIMQNNMLNEKKMQGQLAPLQSRWYAIQDFLQDKFNINGTNNHLSFKLDRDSLRFNESGASPTYDEIQVIKKLQVRGFDFQTASDKAYGRNDHNKVIVQDNQLIDTGAPGKENIYDHVGNNAYFNDPRNMGKVFNWMNYIDPNALEGQVETDGSILDYYYATNFIRNHDLGTVQPTAKNLFDWRNYSHDELRKKYSNSI